MAPFTQFLRRVYRMYIYICIQYSVDISLTAPEVCKAQTLKTISGDPGSSGTNLSNDVASDDEDASGITGKNDEAAGHGHLDGLEERGEEVRSNSANIFMPPAEPSSRVSPSPSAPIPLPANRSASLTPDTVVEMDNMPAQNELHEEAITRGLDVDGIDGHAKEVGDSNSADIPSPPVNPSPGILTPPLGAPPVSKALNANRDAITKEPAIPKPVKRSRPAKRVLPEETLASTHGKRLRSRPAPKEILTLVKRAQSNSVMRVKSTTAKPKTKKK